MHKYNDVSCQQIPAEADRNETKKNGVTVDSFNIKAWWLSHRSYLPNLFQLLRAVLLHSPNSCPPERLFSILNDSSDTD